MVQSGGQVADRRHSPGTPGGGERRHPVAMSGLAAMLAAVAALGVVSVAVVDSDSSIAELAQKQEGAAVHSLHFLNTLHPRVEAHDMHTARHASASSSALAATASGIVGDTHAEVLSSAKIAAQKRLHGASMPKVVQAESREELKLKRELDASVKVKERDALKQSLRNRKDMKGIMAMAAEADKAKHFKVKVVNAQSNSASDMSEERALRKQLDADARQRQANLLKKADPDLRNVRGRHERMSVAASHLAGKKMSESALEADLRKQLNSKVKTEEHSMFKTAVKHWLGAVGTSTHAAGERGRSARRLQRKAAAVNAGHTPSASRSTPKHGDSLELAERMMKHELAISKHPGQDTTLQHSTLRAVGNQAKKLQPHPHGLAQLEKVMLQSALSKTRTQQSNWQKQHEMMHKLRRAAQVKARKERGAKGAGHPSYTSVMKHFATRLMHKEASARAAARRRILPSGEKHVVHKKALEAAIKEKMESKMARGDTRLAAARAQLQQQFDTGHSAFAKAERDELKSLQTRVTPAALHSPDVKDSWHL